MSVLTQSGAANANCATDSNGYYVCADCGACGLDHTEPGKVVCKKGADCQIPRACNGDETRCVSAGELQTCIAGQWQVRQCGASEECWTSTGSPPACRPKLNGTIRIGQSAIAFSNPSLIGQTFGASTSSSKEQVLTGAIEADTLIVAAGTRIRVPGGQSLKLRANKVVVEGGGAVIVDGTGSPGTDNASHGEMCEHCKRDGVQWRTDRKEDFEAAAQECREGRAAHNYGRKGPAGGTGGSGGTVEFEVKASITQFVCSAPGGPGGKGGPGGVGRMLVHNTGGEPKYECHSGDQGDNGSPGANGVCRLNRVQVWPVPPPPAMTPSGPSK